MALDLSRCNKFHHPVGNHHVFLPVRDHRQSLGRPRKRTPLTQELISIGTSRTALVPNSDAIMGGEEEDYCDCDLSWSSRHCPACSSSLPPLHHACPPAHGAAASIPGCCSCSPRLIWSCCWAALPAGHLMRIRMTLLSLQPSDASTLQPSLH